MRETFSSSFFPFSCHKKFLLLLIFSPFFRHQWERKEEKNFFSIYIHNQWFFLLFFPPSSHHASTVFRLCEKKFKFKRAFCSCLSTKWKTFHALNAEAKTFSCYFSLYTIFSLHLTSSSFPFQRSSAFLSDWPQNGKFPSYVSTKHIKYWNILSILIDWIDCWINNKISP